MRCWALTGRVKFLKVNGDEAAALAGRFNIRGVPTLLFFKEGVAQDQLVGSVSAAESRQRLAALIGPPKTAQAAGI